ncbi:chemotaxis protein CheW [Oceanospirillum maris]|uniref:chemotaxis protein CheW n=1 Tax=Oceanospirillum maris TaxID=64977 RepID=UPI0003FD107D|nr:chemotaxis protein CheW [Oceanospirillum maris]
MSFDLSQFNQLFFEETAEHLTTMESLMLNMDVQNPDMDDMNAVFRAAHSIKGNSGTFGFNDMTAVTHELETLLDLVRKGETALTDAMVDVTLQAGDVLGGMLAAHQNEEEPDTELADAVIKELNRQLELAQNSNAGAVVPDSIASRSMILEPESNSAVFGSPASDPGAINSEAIDSTALSSVELETFAPDYTPSETPLTQSYIVRFPAPGDELDMLFDSLKELGDLTIIDAPSENSQDWLFSIQTDSSKEDLKDLITFMVPEESLSIDEELSARDGSFGFFEAVGTESIEDELGYGFFDDLDNFAGDTEESSDDDLGYGFFDLPEDELADPSVECADSDAISREALPASLSSEMPVEAPDLGYGFFDDEDDLSGPTVESIDSIGDGGEGVGKGKHKEENLNAPEGQTEFDGYGFFEPVKDSGQHNNSATTQESKSSAVAGSAVRDKPVNAKKTNIRAAKAESKALPQSKGASPAVKNNATESSIRVSVEKVDQLINQVGELVITQAMLAQMASEVDPILHEKMANGLAQLERNTRDLQDSVMSIRMMPISIVFSRFPRVVRDLAGKLDKKVKLEMLGENTELDRSMIEKLTDPLTHLIRNSLDHGVESPAERIAAGKEATGTILLRASHQGGNIVVEVQDDGAGLNRERILSKAQEKGLPVTETMPDADVWQLIFAPGFSTAAEVTDVSGRGVGMDVVKRNITSLGGRLEIESVEGIGSRISIRLPLTLAILDGLQIALGDEIYIIPLTSIIGSMQPDPADIKTVSGEGAVIFVRDEYLPIIKLGELLNMPAAFDDYQQGIMIILESNGKRVGLFVDDLVGQSQVVIKSLEANYRKVDGVSGATILGTGRVALILDVSELIGMHKKRTKKQPNSILA